MPEIKTRKKEQDDQVNDMFDHSQGKKKSESKSEKEEIDEAGKQTELELGQQGKDEKSKDEEKGEESKKQASPDVSDEQEETVEEKLRRRVAELETGKAFEQQEAKEEKEPVKKETKEAGDEKETELMEFVTEDEFEEMQTNPKKVNEIMLRVYQRAVADTSEKVMKEIPSIVQQSSARQVTLAEAVREFYTDNPDLRNHAQYVGYVANQLKAQNPDMDIKKVLAQTESKVREDLAITKQAKEQEEERRKTDDTTSQPAFAKRGSGNLKGGKQDSRNDFQKEADDMLKAFTRR